MPYASPLSHSVIILEEGGGGHPGFGQNMKLDSAYF